MNEKEVAEDIKERARTELEDTAVLRAIHESCGAINTPIVLAVRGIVLKTSRTSLAKYGGHTVLC